MATARYLGVDLAWREDRADLRANETGVAAIGPRGQILDAGWRRGVDEVVAWPTRWPVAGTPSCSWTRRWWSATKPAGGSARPRSGSVMAGGRSAPPLADGHKDGAG